MKMVCTTRIASIGSASEFGLHHPAFNPAEESIEGAARYFALLAEEALLQP